MSLKYVLTIRDPFHGNMRFTEFERRIIDLEVFQRLRGLKQSSLAHYTYPTALTTRFEHSLGTAHVASNIYSHLQERCPAELAVALRRIRQLYGYSRRDLADIAHQGVRLAALLHDLGHLPFSHCFEDDLHLRLLDEAEARRYWGSRPDEYGKYVSSANEQQGPYRPALHEYIGYRIAAGHRSIRAAAKDTDNQTAYEIGLSLLNPVHSPAAADPIISQVLGSVIHGDCDADRMDFVRRDAGMAGTLLGGFDIDRLIDSLVLLRDSGRMHLLPDVRGLSALEAFFTARLAIYRWQYHHHNVIYHDLVLKLLVRMALNGQFRRLTKHDFLNELSLPRLMGGRGVGSKAASWIPRDDGLVLEVLMEVYTALRKEDGKRRSVPDRRALVMLEEVLFRRKRRVALWKDHIGYSMFAEAVRVGLRDRIANHSGVSAEDASEAIKEWLEGDRVKAIAGSPPVACNVFIQRIRDQRRLVDLQAWLWDHGLPYAVIDHRRVTAFARKKAGGGSEVQVAGREGDHPRVRSMTAVSDVLRGLYEVRNQEVRLFAYELLPEQRQNRPDVERMRKSLAEKMVEWFASEAKMLSEAERDVLKLNGPQRSTARRRWRSAHA